MMENAKSGGTGGCLCGAVRYRYEGVPASIGLCQCRRCQRQSGSAFLIGVVVPKHAVTIEGELTTFEFETGGQRLRRHFCPICGSAVSITLDRFPEIRSMMGGTLDDRTIVKPTFSIWCSEGQPWLELPKGIACFPDYPDGTFA
jgi:hypothetical protein